MRPTSASSMFALTCILVRSAARMKSVGADMPALTVWPGSTAREITMPSMGAAMTVCARLTCAVFNCDLAWTSPASDDRICASAEWTLTSAVSSSVRGSSCFSNRTFARSSFCFASASETLSRSRSASGAGDVRPLLLDRASAASVGSSRAMTCPFLHDVVEVGVQLLDDAADLRADLDGRHGLERPGRRHDLDDVPAGDGRRLHLGFLGPCGSCNTRRRRRRWPRARR